MTNFSIIIPHHNIPDLLQRCLASIPSCEDIQVIIVDDTSSAENVAKVKNIEREHPSFEFYYNQEGKGAGHARNIGLDHAIGKWLIFADADDMFTENIKGLMDKYGDSGFDIIYFGNISKDSLSLMPARRHVDRMRDFKRLANHPKSLRRWLTCEYTEPWGKFIKRELLADNNIAFEESKVANDFRFSTLCALTANEIGHDLTPLYCVTVRQGSLCNDMYDAEEKMISRLKVYHGIQEIYLNVHIPRRPFNEMLQDLLLKGKLSDNILNQIDTFFSYKKSQIYRMAFSCIFKKILRRMFRILSIPVYAYHL